MVTPSLNEINKMNGAQWTNQKLGHMHMMRTQTSDGEGQSTQKKSVGKENQSTKRKSERVEN